MTDEDVHDLVRPLAEKIYTQMIVRMNPNIEALDVVQDAVSSAFIFVQYFDAAFEDELPEFRNAEKKLAQAANQKLGEDEADELEENG